MDKNYKLLVSLKYCINLMKILGIFVQRCHRKPEVSRAQVDFESDTYAHSNESDMKMEMYLIKYEITKETKIKKLHLIYCVILHISKIIFFGGSFVYFTYFSKEYAYFVKENTKIKTEMDSFKFKLIQSVSIFGILFFLFLPIYFYISISSKNGFFKSVLSFEYIENKIKELFERFNQQQNNSVPLNHSSDLHKFQIIYFFIWLVLILIYVSGSITGNTSLTVQLNYTETVFFYILSFYQILVLNDFLLVLYFLSINLMLIYSQIGAFNRYTKAVIKNQRENKTSIDIESIRNFYDDLYEHVKINDKWICFYYGIAYLFSFPSLCVIIYSFSFGSISFEFIVLCLPTLILILLTLTVATVTAVKINIEVLLECIIEISPSVYL